MKDVGWDRFADIMVGKLFHTDISKEAFAVGINGEWGSGKTTFLNEIRKRIKGHAYVIDFFPWLSNSPAQIVKDYFARIKEIFDNKDTSSSIIDDYVDLIIDMDVDSSLTKMAKLVKHRNSLSLEYARKKVVRLLKVLKFSPYHLPFAIYEFFLLFLFMHQEVT